MRVVIVGAGSVGRSIATELLDHGHETLLIDKEPAAIRVASVPDAQWLLADACEISTLSQANLATADVVVAASGDDKVNLVISLLAKTEYAVARTIARVNNPKNEWMFDEAWGVDVAVSTPRLMTSLVEEAVEIGDLVKIFGFQRSDAALVGMTLPDSSPVIGRRLEMLTWPADTALVAIVRAGHAITPTDDDTLEAGDELLYVTTTDQQQPLQHLLNPHHPE